MSPPPPPKPEAHEGHTTFFRQSSWLVLATVVGGVFMSAVHVVANQEMELAEYGVFCALLRVLLLMGIPTVGVQVVFAQQAAAAVTEPLQRDLGHTVRAILATALVLWLGMAAVALMAQGTWTAALKIRNPAALWVTVAIALASLWLPVLRGLLQGHQDFLGLGWVLILDGVGRFVAVAVILWLGGQAAGGMLGALIGQGGALVLATWLARRDLLRFHGTFAWRPWLRRVLPLTFGTGVIAFMSNADAVFIQSVFPGDRTPLYMAGAIIGVALTAFTAPLVAVMFPKVVRSAALTRETQAVGLALGLTAALGAGAALVCTVVPSLPLRVIYFANARYWAAAPLVPWFAWGLLPLLLANVLIGNLLARERFRVVPWLVLVALAYAVALAWLRPRLSALADFTAFRSVVGTLGLFNLLLFAVAGWFTWHEKVPVAAGAP